MSLHNPLPMSTPSRVQAPRTASVAVDRERRSVDSSIHEAAGSQSPPVPLPDVFLHPAVVAWGANHPNRPLPKFGAYFMLQTLGEGEFGKVKLGIHSKYGEEVAVKLIRREAADHGGKMAKIAREIEILDMLKHPNIVRLYDVVETDKYFGIIIEYASGGELFDHILAHRYLRERDACKLFSQLISGVWYMHSKNIVHRDLKLENLLLDRNRNLLITDFGFANRFSHNRNDLMETMCGSPCYAAPELVNSEGLYVGTAADVWSCGVILFAMCAGYLPFDDDPTNPDGNDITKLYAYINRTPLIFPDHLSEPARSLLSIMLVPDPHRRADLGTVMRHPWFAMYGREVITTFGLTAMELERLAEDNPTWRRLAYRRRANTNNNGSISPQASRSPAWSRRQRPYAPDEGDWDPFMQADSPLKDMVGSPRKQRAAHREKGKEREDPRRERHTIQIEYEERRRAQDGRARTPPTSAGPSPDVYANGADANEDFFVAGSPTKDWQRRISRSSGAKPEIRALLPTAPLLDSTNDIPASGRNGKIMDENIFVGANPSQMQRGFEAMYKQSQPPQSRPDTGTSGRNKARTLLAPIVVDSPANTSASKEPFSPNANTEVPPETGPSKPNKVMQWFRRGRRSLTGSGLSPGASSARVDASASSVSVASVPSKMPPQSPGGPFLVTPGTAAHRQRTTSAVSITSLFRRSAGVAGSNGGSKAAPRVHHGAVDHEMITAGQPLQVMQYVVEVLSEMGIDVEVEGDYKYRCSRPAKRRDRRDVSEAPGGGGGSRVFLGVLGRRQPSPARVPIQSENDSSKSSSALSAEQSPRAATVYGEITEDVGDEVRFSVELTRLDRLKDMHSVDVRRLKGNLKSYKFIYDTLRMRADFQR